MTRLGGSQAVGTSTDVSRRHVVTNIHFEELHTDAASVSSSFTVLPRRGLDHFGRCHYRLVLLGDRWLLAHRTVVRDRQPSEPAQPLD